MKRSVLGLLLLFVFAGNANAVPVTCVSENGLPCIANRGDILAGPITVPPGGSDFENIVEAAILTATGTAVDIYLYGKSDANAELFSFSNFDEGASLEESKNGIWTVLDGTLISYLTVKSGNSFAVYQFSPAASTGGYTSEGLIRNGNQLDVSHMSFWTTTTTHVPEPASMMLLGLGAAVIFFRKRSA